MRNIRLYIYPALAAMALLMACEPDVLPEKEPDDEEIVDPKPEPPTPPAVEEDKEPSYDNLSAYDVLKNYVNRDMTPDFKLGAGVNVPSYLQQGQVYDLAVSNFNELTAGNAMKQASVLRRDGSMDFTEVKKFIDMLEIHKMNVFHWHLTDDQGWRIENHIETAVFKQGQIAHVAMLNANVKAFPCSNRPIPVQHLF